ncbi:hypothetical protein Vsou_17130 [Vulcanisaeta souniana JCM 11219]|uniref:DUF309 domain-containing protein n=2 Tax=Vulcanisaeta souniana JCM 11219 TaxID=1293586 RepID=A0ABM8BNM2_9CREN|nr:hypothetical protein Vsou_17130 [Vulcanisaeta souniana JCM 11219]
MRNSSKDKIPHDHRVLVIASNPGFKPVDRQALMDKLRTASLRIINIRVASRHVEIDLYIDDYKEIEKIKALGFNINELVNIGEETKNASDAHDHFVRLFNAERFWEAHEVLEDVWRRNRDEGIRGLIILAAAFVKIQENNLEAFKRLMIRARELIAKNEIPYINRERLLRKIDNALLITKPFKIEKEDLESIQKT